MGDKISYLTKHKHMEMNMKLNLISIAVLAALGASVGAQAAQLPFTFDPTGTAGAAGDIANVGIVDWAPGTGYAVNGVTAINNFVAGSGSTGLTLYYQANLSAMQGFDTSFKFGNGQGGDFFTAVAGFGEKVLSVGANNSATFGFDPTNPVNFFTIFATSAQANNLNGTGFKGTPILQAHLVNVVSSNFTVQSTTPVLLDQGGGNGDQWSGQQSVAGSGSTDITAVVDSVDVNYFPDMDLVKQLVFTLFNSSQVDPFNQVDPSKCMNTATSTIACVGGINTVGTVGTLNGATGPSFIFQADGNQSFSVPEPGSLALLGLGMAALGFVGSRRRAS